MFTNKSMDPEDWANFKKVSTEILEEMIDFIASADSHKLANFPDIQALAQLKISENQKGIGLEGTYSIIRDHVLPHSMMCTSPRYMGWAQGAGNPVSMLADLIASSMNEAVDGFHGSPHFIEKESIEWLKNRFGFPSESSGCFVSGASVANLIGLHVARNSVIENMNQTGLLGYGKPLKLYASAMTHFSIKKALVILGLGTDSLREIPVDHNFEIDLKALEETIEQDIAYGFVPFCVVANAGTTGVGSVDDLRSISRICKKHGIWMHVDGAIGAIGCLSPRLQKMMDGLSEADSIAFDLHKWMNINYEIGCILVRSKQKHTSSLEYESSYLNLSKKFDDWISLGLQTTRSFRALKFWMAIKVYGVDGFINLLNKTLDLSQSLKGRLESCEDFELMAPVKLNVVCFRYKGSIDQKDEYLNRLNEAIFKDLIKRGTFIISYEIIDGKYCLRTCIINHRMTDLHLQELLEEVRTSGKALTTGPLHK